MASTGYIRQLKDTRKAFKKYCKDPMVRQRELKILTNRIKEYQQDRINQLTKQGRFSTIVIKDRNKYTADEIEKSQGAVKRIRNQVQKILKVNNV